jgi:hypothetical protein
MGEAAPPGAVEFVQKRRAALSKSLGDKPYLDGDRFTAGEEPLIPPKAPLTFSRL